MTKQDQIAKWRSELDFCMNIGSWKRANYYMDLIDAAIAELSALPVEKEVGQ